MDIAFKMGIRKRTVHYMYTNWYMEANSGSSRRAGEQLLAYHHSEQKKGEKGKQIGGWLGIKRHTLHIRREGGKAYGQVEYQYQLLRNE